MNQKGFLPAGVDVMADSQPPHIRVRIDLTDLRNTEQPAQSRILRCANGHEGYIQSTFKAPDSLFLRVVARADSSLGQLAASLTGNVEAGRLVELRESVFVEASSEPQLANG